jgi:hypothetical protein
VQGEKAQARAMTRLLLRALVAALLVLAAVGCAQAPAPSPAAKNTYCSGEFGFIVRQTVQPVTSNVRCTPIP